MKPVTFFEDGQAFTLTKLVRSNPDFTSTLATHTIARGDGLKSEISAATFRNNSFEDTDGVFYVIRPLQLMYQTSFVVSMELAAKIGRHVHTPHRFEVASDEHHRLVKFGNHMFVYTMRKNLFEFQYNKLQYPDRSKVVAQARDLNDASYKKLLDFGLDTPSIELAVVLYAGGVRHPRTLWEAVNAVSQTPTG